MTNGVHGRAAVTGVQQVAGTGAGMALSAQVSRLDPVIPAVRLMCPGLRLRRLRWLIGLALSVYVLVALSDTTTARLTEPTSVPVSAVRTAGADVTPPDTPRAVPADHVSEGVQPTASPAAIAQSLPTFAASYDAYYNGGLLGSATLSLAQLGDCVDIASALTVKAGALDGEVDTHAVSAAPPASGCDATLFEMSYRMRATRGMASIVGAKLDEVSRFLWSYGQARPLRFSHRSKAFLSKTVWDAEFDLTRQQVSGEYEGDAYRLDYANGLSDPLLQFIDGAQRSSENQQQWQQDAVVKGEIRPYYFARDSAQTLITPCLTATAWRVVRSRDTSSATQELWYSQATGVVPLRIRKVQRDGDVLDLRLSQLTLEQQQLCALDPAVDRQP